MVKTLVSSAVMGMVLALVLVAGVFVGTSAAVSWSTGYDTEFGIMADRDRDLGSRVDRDLGEFRMNDVNQFGDDRAYSSARGTDMDADLGAFEFRPETYGLQGDYWRRSGGAGGAGN
ncbi:MAG: hypothetical protein WAW37_12845 [Syntrophobacteraceae bacterium]